MSRINTNVASLIAQRTLGQNNSQQATTLERLSTGLRINRGKDDPAGLIASQALRAEIRGIDQAIKNSERADQVVGIAEGGLQEISGLLTELQGLVTQTANTAGLSASEKEANQLQIDSILQTIDRVSSATSFQGTKLLNGSFEYEVSGVDASVDAYTVNGAKLNPGDTRDVDIQVTQSAQTAALRLSFGGANLNLGGGGGSFVFEVAGSKGSRELSFASGVAITDIASTINTFSDITGVSASISGTGVRLDSVEFGDNEFVSVDIVADPGAVGDGVITYDDADATATGGAGSATVAFAAGASVKDEGQDLGAFINGVAANTSGKTARINTDFLDVEISLTTAASQAIANLDAFTIEGGGADFQLAGTVDIGGKVSLGLGNVAARELGNVTDSGTTYSLANLGAGGALNVVDGDLTVAQKAVEEAISSVSELRGRLGAFQKNTVGATTRSLGVTLENTIAAESIIRDADFAQQTSELTRTQILSQAATNVLAIANQQPQNALALLG